MKGGFENAALEEAVAVGRVGPHEARIWVRAREAGRYVLTWWPEEAPSASNRAEIEVREGDSADNTISLRIPSDESLNPLTRYRYRVTAASDERVLGNGRFETTPVNADQAPEEFSFAIMSCNQPFDADGRIRDDAREMLRAVRAAAEEHDCKFLLMMGDQMYSDMPSNLSLFNQDHFRLVAPDGRSELTACTTEEVRRIYQKRYRYFLGIPEMQQLLANFPSYPILDDHDIVDNWGSDPKHIDEPWQSVGRGARWAYYDYQGSHVLEKRTELPTSFHYSVDYGPASIFVMDLRSERWVDADGGGRLYSEEQGADLDAFLERTKRQTVLFFVLSVPPIHLPRALAASAAHATPSGEDFSDRWSSLGHVDDRDRFFRKIREHQREHPRQRHIMLAGDIHVGCAQEITWDDDGERLYQFVSSGLTNKAGSAIRLGAKWLMHFNQSVKTRDGDVRARVRLLDGVDGRTRNPYGKLNIGIVRVRTPSPGTRSTLEFYLYGHEGDRPVCVFQSPVV